MLFPSRPLLTVLLSSMLLMPSCQLLNHDNGEQLSIHALDQTDQQLFQRLDRLYAQFRSDAAVIFHESYRLDQDIVYLVRQTEQGDQYGYVLNHPNPDALRGAVAVELPQAMNLPDVYKVTRLKQRKLRQIPNYDFEYRLGGEDVLVMKYNDEDMDPYSAPISDDWSLYLAHEGLHRHEILHWVDVDNNQDLTDYNFSAEHLSLIALEHSVLADAFRATALDETKQLTKQFLAIRHARIEQYGEQIRTLDGAQERAEGAARYLEFKLAELLDFEEGKATGSADELEWDGMPEEHIKEMFGFDRFYTTGSVLSVLLDRFDIDWEQRLMEGETQYQILLSELGPLSDTPLIADAKKAQDFEFIQRWAADAAVVAATEPDDMYADDV